MTIDPQQQPGFSAALARGLTSRRMSRRNMLKLGGVSVGALSMSSILAACSSRLVHVGRWLRKREWFRGRLQPGERGRHAELLELAPVHR